MAVTIFSLFFCCGESISFLSLANKRRKLFALLSEKVCFHFCRGNSSNSVGWSRKGTQNERQTKMLFIVRKNSLPFTLTWELWWYNDEAKYANIETKFDVVHTHTHSMKRERSKWVSIHFSVVWYYFTLLRWVNCRRKTFRNHVISHIIQIAWLMEGSESEVSSLTVCECIKTKITSLTTAKLIYPSFRNRNRQCGQLFSLLKLLRSLICTSLCLWYLKYTHTPHSVWHTHTPTKHASSR